MYKNGNITYGKARVEAVDATKKDTSPFITNIVSSDFPYSHILKPRRLVLGQEARLRLDLQVPHCLSNKRCGNLGKRIYDNLRFESLRPLPPWVGKPYKLIHLDDGISVDIHRAHVPFKATIHCLSGCISITSQDQKHEEVVVLSAESDVVVAPTVSVRLECVGGRGAQVLFLEIDSQFASDDELEIYAPESEALISR